MSDSSDNVDEKYESIPDELKEEKIWLLWDSSADEARQPHWKGDFDISWSDPDDWHSFEEAVEATKEKKSWGIGYVNALENEEAPRQIYVTIDIDGGINDDGKLEDWVPPLDVFKENDVYIEKSPSGKGLHIPLVGYERPGWWEDLRLSEDDHEGIEVLDNKFCTVTGDKIKGAGDKVCDFDITPWLEEVHKNIKGHLPEKSVKSNHQYDDSGKDTLSPEQIEEALSHIDPDVNYPIWRNIGFSLVSELENKSIAESIFKWWSKDGNKWDADAEGLAERIIEDADFDGDITGGTLVYHAKKGGWGPSFLDRKKDVGDEEEPQESDEEQKKKNALTRLIDIGFDVCEDFLIDERDIPHAVIEGGGHLEIQPIEGKKFKQYLSSKFYEKEELGVPDNLINSAINTICAKSRFSDESKNVELKNRIAWHDGDLFYFLADDKWNAIKITEERWEFEEDPPLIFRKTAHQNEQVRPKEKGDIDEIFEFINISDNEERLLLKVYVVSCFIPEYPHPIPVFEGPHGSAKSFSMKILKELIDPCTPTILDIPYKKDELILQFYWQYAPFYDNISTLKGWQSDLLCRASTGEGYSKRKLYSDEGSVIYQYRRCVSVNGISIAGIQPDLRDRMIQFTLSQIPPCERKKEEELLQEFKEIKPGILGDIFNIISNAMQIKKSVELDELPRMADFAEWGEAISRAMGYDENEFLSAYLRKKGSQRREALEENPIGLAVLKLMEEKDRWEGNSTELLDELEDIADDEGIDTDHQNWPGNASWMTRRLEKVEADLSQEGFEIDTNRWKNDRRSILIRKDEGEDEDDDESVTDPSDDGGTTDKEQTVQATLTANDVSEKEKEKVIEIMKDGGNMSPSELAECGGLDEDEVSSVLSQLKEEGKIGRIENGEQVKYGWD